MANSIKIGGFSFDALKIGSSDVDAAYLGDTLVYSGGTTPPTPSYKWLATYSGGTTSSAECNSSSAITQNEINKTNLVSVEIGDCVTSIGNEAFQDCTGLTSISIPDTVTSIGMYAFAYCSGLTSIDIPDSVTNIDQNTFRSCTGLASITIPYNVTSIGSQVLYGCNSLTNITILPPIPPTLGLGAFNATNSCPIYVPSESVDTYKAASDWSDYASRIQAIQPTPTYQWVLYNEGDTVPASLVYGVKLYTSLAFNYSIDFGVDDYTGVAFVYDHENEEWTALDIASSDPIDISGYFDGDSYTILFSDIGYGGMPVSYPITGQQFEFDIDLYEQI